MSGRTHSPEDAAAQLRRLGVDVTDRDVFSLERSLCAELVEIVLMLRPFGIEHRQPCDPTEAALLRARGRQLEQQLALVGCLFDDPSDIVEGRARGFGTPAERARWARACAAAQAQRAV
jgi:hypothetical protein